MKSKLLTLLLLFFILNYEMKANYEFHTTLDQTQKKLMIIIYEQAPKYRIDPRFAANLAFAESSFRTSAVSYESRNRKSVGPMQVLISTGKWLGYSEKDIHNPFININIGLEYLQLIKYKYYGRTVNDIATAATYNHGIGNMKLKLSKGPVLYKDLPRVTRKYLKNIFRKDFEDNFIILEEFK